MGFMFFIEQNLGKFPHFVLYALLEWVMIILLFIDGFLSFVSNEFAKLFELRIPCLLCTRIDHVIVHREKSFYYNESVCEIHKKDISTLAYCHMHKKLSDFRNMCEKCLLSFATAKGSDGDGYKTLVGILNKDSDGFVEGDRKLFEHGGSNKCCCCGEALKPKAQSKKYSRSDSMSNSSLQAPTSSPRGPWKSEEPKNMDLPHRFSKLKFVQDNKSEIPDDDNVPVTDTMSREDIKAIATQLLPDPDDINTVRTPTFSKGSKFFGISLSDSAHASPRARSRKSTLEKVDFNPDSTDSIALSEVNGDSIVHHLKKQVRLDRKSLIDLYMELDEERNASAIAANNAMAMITRLQAEKAAVQMEALQYQRMMDEQAEYDQEALQILKDLLLKREEEIKILESELETFREKYGDIKKVGSEICEVDDEDYQNSNFNRSQSLSSFGDKSDNGSFQKVYSNQENDNYFEHSKEHEEDSQDVSSLDFEKERSYLLGLLMDLEKKMGSHAKEESTSSSSDTSKKENESKTLLTREVSMIRERLRGIEASSGFLKHAAMTLQKGSEGAKLLMEIAEHLRELRHPIEISSMESHS